MMFVSKMDFVKSPTYGDNPNSLFPKDVEEIPAFSLLEVYVMSKPGDPTMNRENVVVPRMSCVRFCMVRPCLNSLYSYRTSLGTIAGTLEEAKKAAFAKREKYEVISKDVECESVAFVVGNASRTAVVSDGLAESDGLVSVVGWSEDAMDADVALDVPVDVLLRYTNSTSLQWSMTLLELALNMGCVSFLVFCSDYFRKGGAGSHLRAVPVLDTRGMLDVMRLDSEQAVTEADEEGVLVSFDTGAVHRNEAGRDEKISVSVRLLPEYTRLEGADLPCRDLILCTRAFDVAKAHPIHFSVAAAGEVPEIVLRGFLRVDGQASGGGAGRKRIRFGCADV